MKLSWFAPHTKSVKGCNEVLMRSIEDVSTSEPFGSFQKSGALVN